MVALIFGNVFGIGTEHSDGQLVRSEGIVNKLTGGRSPCYNGLSTLDLDAVLRPTAIPSMPKDVCAAHGLKPPARTSVVD